MKRLVFLTAGVLALLASALVARADGSLELRSFTAIGGSSRSSGGPIVLAANSGRADAGIMTGGVLTVRGGFRPGAEATATPTPTVTATVTATETPAPTVTPTPGKQFIPSTSRSFNSGQ